MKGIKRWKRAVSLLLAVGTLSSLNSTSYAENTIINPIGVEATELKDGVFAINITSDEQIDMQAYKYVLRYDANKVKVAGSAVTAYGYYQSFFNTYYTDGGSIAIYNNKVNGENSYVIFTGAQANESAAIVEAETNISYVKFEAIEDVKDEAAYEELLSGIALTVEHLEGSQGNLVTANPEVFAKSVAVKRGATLGGEDLLLGDLDGDLDVTLDDVRIILKGALAIEQLSREQNLAADVDNDNQVTLDDVRLVLQAALQIIVLS